MPYIMSEMNCNKVYYSCQSFMISFILNYGFYYGHYLKQYKLACKVKNNINKQKEKIYNELGVLRDVPVIKY